MKIRFTFFFLMILFLQSCSDKSDYKDAISKWAEINLNDPASYEPIDYEILDSTFIKYNNIEYSNYKTAIQRRSDLLYILKEHLEKGNHNKDFQEIYALNDSINKNIQSIWNFNKVKDLNEKISRNIEDSLTPELFSDQYYLSIISQIEGTNFRIQSEERKLENFLNINCLSDNPLMKMKDKKLIKHSFRAKNEFGAKVLNERIFELNSDRSTVNKSCKIK